MTAVVQAMWQPDRAAMLQHVEHLFGGFLDGYHDGLIELAWTDDKPDEAGRYRLKNARLFGTDQLEELVDLAVELNSKPMTNVYIGAALRHPDTAPFGRCTDEDAWALPAFYTDLDDEGVTARVKSIYGDTKPTLVVLTGKEPYTRAQLWWRLAEPINDPVLWSAALKGMARALDGDTTVTNPGRVMRLAGSIAWPVKPGRTVELTAINPLKKPGPPEYMAEHLLRVFPPAAADQSAPVQVTETVTRSTNSLGLPTGKITDGRESKMRDVVARKLIDFIGENGAVPTPQELYDEAWPVYSEIVDLSRPGRGPDELAEKCRYAIKRFESGEIRGIRTVDDAIAVYQRKQAARETAKAVGVEYAPKAPRQPSGPIEILTTPEFVGRWSAKPFLLKPIIEGGRLYTMTGPTGTGKTAIALLLALHIARGEDLAGRRVHQAPVLFLAGENPDDVRTRWLTMLKIEGIAPETVDVSFIEGRFSIEGHYDVIKAHIEQHPTGLVIVDTLQAFFDGDDSNSNEQMKALAHVLRRVSIIGPAVVVPAHPTKNATKDRNVPYGGNALLNEIDGNLSLWGDADNVQLSWCGKFRGSFEPIDFALDVVEMPGVVDPDGDPVKTIKARTLEAREADKKAAEASDMHRRLLFLIHDRPRQSERQIAEHYAARFPDAKRTTVQRRMRDLEGSKLIEKTLDKWELTAKGRRMIGVEGDE